MKHRYSYLILALGAIAAGITMMLTAPPVPVQAAICGAASTAQLIGESGGDIGDLTVWNDARTLYLTVTPEAGWQIAAASLHVGARYAAIPRQASGTLDHTRFATQMTFSPAEGAPTLTAPMPFPADTRLVLALRVELMQLESGENTAMSIFAWGDKMNQPVDNRWYFTHAVGMCR